MTTSEQWEAVAAADPIHRYTDYEIRDQTGNIVATVYARMDGQTAIPARLMAASPRLLEALERAIAAFEYQVEVCHAREAAFLDRSISARPMDYQELVANMYAATADPLEQARTVIKAATETDYA